MRFKRTLVCLSISLLSACVSTSGTEKPKHSVNTNSVKFSPIAHAHTIELLNFVANYTDQTIEAQKMIFQENLAALANSKTDTKLRIQHSAMLALPNSEMRNVLTAQPLLQNLLSSNELNASETSLVKLLLSYTQDHYKQSTKVRDYMKKNDFLKQKNKALEQKLDDLKNIEKTMIERNAKTNSNL